MNEASKTEALPPHAQLIQMATAYWMSRVVYAAAKLGLADRLAAGPRSAAELAGETGTHAPSLHRLMRTLASLGVLTERDGKRFALTPLGEALRSGAPGAARATVLTLAGPIGWKGFEEMLYSLETGKTGFEKAFGMPVFDYLAQHPDEASQFSETMIGVHGAEPAAVAEAYDFSALGTVVDVGGASGNLLATILGRHAKPARRAVRSAARRSRRAEAVRRAGRRRSGHDRIGKLLRERCRREATRTFSRTSSTTGARSSA